MSKLHLVKTQNSKIVRGEWSLIQWNPDLATEELLNIGVALNIDGTITLKCWISWRDYHAFLITLLFSMFRTLSEFSLPALEITVGNSSQQIKWD